MGITKERINKYDNIRGLAIFMIVIWHLNTVNIFSGMDIYRVMFFVVLPSFFFVSGYFSKIGPDEPMKAFKRLFLPYIIFSVITRIAIMVTSGEGNFHDLFLVSNYLWFLLALFFMKMALPILDKFRYPILTAFIVALCLGFIKFNHSIMGIDRCICYLPIFLLGFYYNDYKAKFEERFTGAYNFIKKYSWLVLILSVAYFIAVAMLISNTQNYLFSADYKGDLLLAMLKRAVILIADMMAVLILNKYMTNKKCVLTKVGINSMAVYVLHYYCYLVLKYPFNNFSDNKLLFVPVLLISAAIVTWVLSRDFVTKGFNKFTDFFYDLIVKAT